MQSSAPTPVTRASPSGMVKVEEEVLEDYDELEAVQNTSDPVVKTDPTLTLPTSAATASSNELHLSVHDLLHGGRGLSVDDLSARAPSKAISDIEGMLMGIKQEELEAEGRGTVVHTMHSLDEDSSSVSTSSDSSSESEHPAPGPPRSAQKEKARRLETSEPAEDAYGDDDDDDESGSQEESTEEAEAAPRQKRKRFPKRTIEQKAMHKALAKRQHRAMIHQRERLAAKDQQQVDQLEDDDDSLDSEEDAEARLFGQSAAPRKRLRLNEDGIAMDATPSDPIEDLRCQLLSHESLRRYYGNRFKYTDAESLAEYLAKLFDIPPSFFSALQPTPSSVRIIDAATPALRTRHDGELPTQVARHLKEASWLDGCIAAVQLIARLAGATDVEVRHGTEDTDLLYVHVVVLVARRVDLWRCDHNVGRVWCRLRRGKGAVFLFGGGRDEKGLGSANYILPIMRPIWDHYHFVTFTSSFLVQHHDDFAELVKTDSPLLHLLHFWVDPSLLAQEGPLSTFADAGRDGPTRLAAFALVASHLLVTERRRIRFTLCSPHLPDAQRVHRKDELGPLFDLDLNPALPTELKNPRLCPLDFDDPPTELQKLQEGSRALLHRYWRFRRAIVLVTEEQKTQMPEAELTDEELMTLEEFGAGLLGRSNAQDF